MAKKRKAPKKKTRPPARRRAPVTTALAVRDPLQHALDGLKQAQQLVDHQRIPADGSIDLGALGFEYPTFTKAEEKQLMAPVPPEEIRIKPNRNPTPYLPHIWYRRKLNEIFGISRWVLKIGGLPKVVDKSVVTPYTLFVRGKAAAAAWGAQEYHPTNKDQTYDDAIEGTYGSALRRCCKQLGVGLEMWDTDYLRAWVQKYAVMVWVKRKDETQATPAWRRKVDPKFWNEADKQGEQKQGRPAPPQAAHTGKEGQPITDPQLKRLITIAKHHSRTDPEVKAYIKRVYGLDSKKAITRGIYDAICTALEKPGALPASKEEATKAPPVLEADDISWDVEPES